MARTSRENFTAAEKRELWSREGGICQYCHLRITSPDGKQTEFHHIKTLADGGEAHDLRNGAVLHKKCHSSHYEILHGTKLARARAMASAAARKWWMFHHRKVIRSWRITDIGCKRSPITCSVQQRMHEFLTQDVLVEGDCFERQCRLTVYHRSDGLLQVEHAGSNLVILISDTDWNGGELHTEYAYWAGRCHTDLDNLVLPDLDAEES